MVVVVAVVVVVVVVVVDVDVVVVSRTICGHIFLNLERLVDLES